MTIEEVVELIVDEHIRLNFKNMITLRTFEKMCDSTNNNYVRTIMSRTDGSGSIYFNKTKIKTIPDYSNVDFDLFCKLTGFKLKNDKTPTLKEEIIKVFKKYDKSDLLHYFTLNSEEKNIVNCFKSRNESPKSREILDNWWKDTFYENYLVSNKI